MAGTPTLRAGARDKEVCLRADRARYFRAERLRERFGVLTRPVLEVAGEDDRFAGERTARRDRPHYGRHDLDVRFGEAIEAALLFGIVQVVVDALRDDRAHAFDRLQILRARLAQ